MPPSPAMGTNLEDERSIPLQESYSIYTQPVLILLYTFNHEPPPHTDRNHSEIERSKLHMLKDDCSPYGEW